MLQNELKSAPGARRPRKRVGRGNGSGHGTYATKGLKGQKARTGNDIRLAFEGGQMPLALKLARKRGFTNKWRLEYEWLNVGQIAHLGLAEVTPESLAAAGALKRTDRPIKILGDGAIDKAVSVSAHAFTASARTKIEAAGGQVRQLPGRATERAERLATAAEAETAAVLAAEQAASEDGEPEGTDSEA
jgi:large subunit ribosomal protein L15